MSTEIEKYLKKYEIKKLHLGCDGFFIPTWLNTDISKKACKKGAIYLDAGKKFQLPSNSFDFIYAEHLFEHLTYEQEKNMLRECYRILKPGGVLRLAMPNLKFLLDLYLYPEKPINAHYIEYLSKELNIPNNAVYAVNAFHTAWGHKVIHDPDSLAQLLIDAGFSELYQSEIGQSKYNELQNIEHHHLHFQKKGCKDNFNRLQTMVFEAVKGSIKNE